MASVKPISRRCPAFRQQVRWPRDNLSLQMGEYLLNDHRVFDAGNDLDSTAAFPTGSEFYIENTLQPLRPAHVHMPFGRGFLLRLIRRFALVAIAPPGWSVP